MSAWRRTVWLAAGLVTSWAPLSAAEALTDDSGATSLMRLFTDSDHVRVRSLTGEYALPLRGSSTLSLHWNNERVTIPAIQAPVGSAEAVDAITTASRPIHGNGYQDFVKVRNEVQGTLARGGAAFEYYVSSESDYLAQQFGAKYNRDVHEQTLNLAVGTSVDHDDIRPLADDDTNTPGATKTTLHWDAVATQILSPTTLCRVGVEYNVVQGLQHSPYRNVYAGGTHVPENVPNHRERRDTFLKLNQYLTNHASLKLHYRLYNDDWGITSHEIGSSLNQYVGRSVSASYEYRYYTQNRATFYRDEYATIDGIDGYRTGDYRLDDLASHLLGVSLHWDMEALGAVHPLLGRLALRLSYERYFNSNNYSANLFETGVDFRVP